MTKKNLDDLHLEQKDGQKEIETGILKAIADITDETIWPEKVDADDVQLIITQLARSAALLRDKNAIALQEQTLKKKFVNK